MDFIMTLLNKCFNWALKHEQIYNDHNNPGPSGSRAGLKARVCSPTTCLSLHRKGFIDSQCHKDLNITHLYLPNQRKTRF